MSIIGEYMLYFFIYAFLGWICESIYCSFLQKKVINRGFLNGPLCPVYGVGALIVIISLWSYRDSMIAVFVLGMILTSVVEYITATILEKLFHAKWWDYSNYKFNIHGKICLLNSTMFGVLSVVVIKFIHPFILNMLDKMDNRLLGVFTVLLTIVAIIDFIITAQALNSLTMKLDVFSNIVDDMKKIHDRFKLYEEEEFLHRFKLNPEDMLEDIRIKFKSFKAENLDIFDDLNLDEKLDEIQDKFKSLKQKAFVHRRIVNAFPNIKSTKSNKRDTYLQYIKKILKERI